VEFLTVDRVERANLRHLAKFRGDRSNCCGDMMIYLFLQYGGRPPSWISCADDWTTHEGRLVIDQAVIGSPSTSIMKDAATSLTRLYVDLMPILNVI